MYRNDCTERCDLAINQCMFVVINLLKALPVEVYRFHLTMKFFTQNKYTEISFFNGIFIPINT